MKALSMWLLVIWTATVGPYAQIAGQEVDADQHAVPTRPVTEPQRTASNRALLDSLGECEGTTLVREYVLENGDMGRQYATSQELLQAVNTVTLFYRNKLRRLGWKTIEEHAAVSAYQKGSVVFSVSRAGPDDPGLPPGATLLKSGTAPADAKFFFAVEAGSAR